MPAKTIYSIYIITNNINGKKYTGYSSDPYIRWANHQSLSRNNKNTKILYKAIRKYGIENFIFEVIYQSLDGRHNRKIMESFFIGLYKTQNPALLSGHQGEIWYCGCEFSAKVSFGPGSISV